MLLLVSAVTIKAAPSPEAIAAAIQGFQAAVEAVDKLVTACARPRALGVVVTNGIAPPGEGQQGVKLVNPQYHVDSGQCDDPPANSIDTFAASDPILFSKTNDVARGTVGLLSYQVDGEEHKLVVMWSVPYDYNFYENWWNVAMYPKGKALDSALFKEMYKTAKKGSQTVSMNIDGWAYEIAGSMGTSGKTTLKIDLKKAVLTKLPKFVRIQNLGTGKWLTHEGGIANQNWISSTGDKNSAVVWEVVGDLNQTTFRVKDSNLFLSYRGSTGACKFVDSNADASFKMEFLPKDGAWTAFNNRWETFLWMYSDPYPYVRSGGDGDTKARWVIEAYGTAAPAGNTAPAGTIAPAKPLTTASLLGSYQREPVENDWQRGQITAGENNTLVWTNAAGVSWRLMPDLANKALRTGADNPYADQGVRDFTIEFSNGEVSGFRFKNEVYRRVAGAAASPSPLPKALTAAAVIGSYQRMPVENDWHKGTISAGPNNTLVWTNAAGVSWNLTPDLASKALRTGADNPYADQGVRDFAIELNNGEVSGFRFKNEVYRRVATAALPPKALTAAAVIGRYQRLPVENDWHKGTISAGQNGTLVWTNAAGVRWTLTPDLANKALRTGADNPYADQGVRDFTIELKNGAVAGFRFKDEVYQRVDEQPR
jgi:hypothetical protein